MAAQTERWPPVYDADDLVREIKRLADRGNLDGEFFDWCRERSMALVEDVCQGDVVHLASDLPLIAETGEPEAVEHAGGMWLVVGNTCDFARTLADAQWTQLVPLVDVGGVDELHETQRSALRRYTQSRRFFVPAWSATTAARVHVADLLLPVAVDKRVFDGRLARVDARMSRAAWILLNACLVRFLARDDGRYDQ